MLDLGLYYMGVVSQPFRRGRVALREPVFSTPPSTPFFHLIAGYNRRLAAMARHRRKRGVWGRRNAGEKFLINGFMFTAPHALSVGRALLRWCRLELTEGWRTWLGD
jgi:hypothetical protein